MQTRMAKSEDLEQLVVLFNAYREFYEQPTDLPGARAFLTERMRAKESVIIVIEDEGSLAGFTQLYPSFSSVSMQRSWILNDLFVLAEHRGKKMGVALIKAAEEFSFKSGAKGLSLMTSVTNTHAQKLYEGLGWTRENKFMTYHLKHSR